MNKIFLKKTASLKAASISFAYTRPVLNFLFAVLIIGVLAGGLIGVYSDTNTFGGDMGQYIRSSVLHESYARAALASFRFVAAALAFSTSFLGVALIPSLVFIRAYTLSCLIGAFCSAFSFRGIAAAALFAGVGSLFALPCFLLLSCDSFVLARQLFMQRFYSAPPVRETALLRHLCVSAPLLVLDSVFSYFWLPKLLAAFY